MLLSYYCVLWAYPTRWNGWSPKVRMEWVLWDLWWPDSPLTVRNPASNWPDQTHHWALCNATNAYQCNKIRSCRTKCNKENNRIPQSMTSFVSNIFYLRTFMIGRHMKTLCLVISPSGDATAQEHYRRWKLHSAGASKSHRNLDGRWRQMTADPRISCWRIDTETNSWQVTV